MVAKLIVASGKHAGRTISLKHGKLLIGRAEECDIRPLGEEVSRRHCMVATEGSGLTVEDLKSRNGTYVNNAKITAKTPVTDGDIIRIGPLELRVAGVVPAPTSASPATAASALDDVSRWLMADDEPAGMFDTTRTVIAGDAAEAAAAPPPAPAAAQPESEATAKAAAEGPTEDISMTKASGIEDIIASKGQPGVLPPEARGPRTANSKDAAAEALRKFFGKR